MNKIALFVTIASALIFLPRNAGSFIHPNALKRSSCQHTDTELRCVQYVRNYDGDTITFNIPKVHPLLGKDIGTRIYGIDTPEMRGDGPCEKEAAKKAQKVVQDMLKDSKRIDIKNIQRDKYFRILGEVWSDGRSVADELIKQKLAYPYFGDTKQKRDWCQKSESIK